MEKEEFKSGFVALIGRPNVGKSTLMNHAIGKKIAIMSNKVQTTRNQIHGVYHGENEQIIFIDTPGIHKPKHQLGKFLTNVALGAFESADLILFLVVADEPLGKGEEYILEHLKETKTPVVLVINKVDLLKSKLELLKKIDRYKEELDFKAIVPISAKNGENTDELFKVIRGELPVGPKYYPEGQITDYPETFIMSEIIREKILHLTKEEIPHSVAVLIEGIEKNEEGNIDVMAQIIVERKSQKGIMIGKGGQMIREIGKRSRLEINRLLGSKIHLELFVKVMPDWRNKMNKLQELGYREF